MAGAFEGDLAQRGRWTGRSRFTLSEPVSEVGLGDLPSAD
jgi:hypothetical protein